MTLESRRQASILVTSETSRQRWRHTFQTVPLPYDPRTKTKNQVVAGAVGGPLPRSGNHRWQSLSRAVPSRRQLPRRTWD